MGSIKASLLVNSTRKFIIYTLFIAHHVLVYCVKRNCREFILVYAVCILWSQALKIWLKSQFVSYSQAVVKERLPKQSVTVRCDFPMVGFGSVWLGNSNSWLRLPLQSVIFVSFGYLLFSKNSTFLVHWSSFIAYLFHKFFAHNFFFQNML